MLNINQVKPYQNNQIGYIVDDNGLLINAEDWTAGFALQVLGLESDNLSVQHRNVLQYVRTKYLHIGAFPTACLICKSTGIEKHELKFLFGACVQFMACSWFASS